MSSGSTVGGIMWDDDGPDRTLEFIPIISPRPHQKLAVVITSDSWTGAYTHFYNQRTHPCLGEAPLCEGCSRRFARRWKAYLCAIMVPGGRRVIVELTVGALDSCPALRHDRGALRGKKLNLWRRGDARNAPVMASLETLKGLEGLPPAFDLMESLCRVWGVHRELGDGEELPERAGA